MKIVSSGSGLHSPEFYRKKQRRRRIRSAVSALGLLTLLFLIVFFSRQERFLIAEAVILGEDVIDKEKIAQTVERELAGYYLLVIPKANILVYPRRALKRVLLEEFPRLKSAHMNLGEFRTLFVTVEERVPSALYCTNGPSPVDNAECFFLDEDGFIFAAAPSFSSAVYFVFAAPGSATSSPGERFMAAEEFKSLTEFMESLSILDIHPLALEILSDGYSLSLPNGGEIVWRRDSELTLIRSNLEAFLSDDSIRAQDDFLNRVLRLDLRTENKVFYKFKD